MPARTAARRAQGVVVALILAAWARPAEAGQAVFLPAADAKVVLAKSGTNYGSQALETRGGAKTAVQSLLRFDVTGLPGPVARATLRLYVRSGTADGPEVRATSNAWDEKTVSWKNKPAPIGDASTDAGVVPANGWLELDVTPLVAGNASHSFLLQQDSADDMTFDSRERSHEPELVVSWQACTVPADCDDGNACTSETCTDGWCRGAPAGQGCNADGNACTVDTCSNGTCTAGPPRVCNDGNACTTDSCDPVTGCTFTPGDSCGPTTLVAMGAIWRYRDTGVDPGPTWTAPGYNDNQWASGAAELGYGDGDEVTVVGYGGSSSNKYITTWFRRAFTVSDAGAIQGLTLRLVRDDGAVVYLNGVEIWRANLPTGPIGATTRAVQAVDDEVVDVVPVAPTALMSGSNVLAVEIHQVGGSSSDISFDLSLATSQPSGPPPPPPPGLFVARGATWKYLDDGSTPASSWRQLSFDDTAWPSGPAELGWGDGDEKTVVGSGQPITTWFRRVFTVEDPSIFREVRLGVRRDDGAAVYVNGTEVLRSNLPGGTLGASTLALASVEDMRFHFAQVPLNLIASGANVVAVEVHQASAASSDASFDLELYGVVADTGPANDPVLVGAGDIASCENQGAAYTAQLIDGIPGTVFAAGDLAYPNGSAADFENCYDPAWGALKARTRPVPGNHEYYTPGAAPYYDYFGAAAGDRAKGYYSYEVGGWLILALNSNCVQVGGCQAGSPQEQWLRSTLAAHNGACAMAYMHHPRFTSGAHGSLGDLRDLWQAMVEHKVELVVSGHVHAYERLAPMDADGRLVADGLTQVIVGTGGAPFQDFLIEQPPMTLIRRDYVWGVLKLKLHASSYHFEFVPVGDEAFVDSGMGACR